MSTIQSPADASGLASARAYVKLKWALVPIPLGQKGPNGSDWNRPENIVNTMERCEAAFGHGPMNMGLVHEYSGTVAIDVDDEAWTRVVLEEFGVDLDALLAGGPRITSGRAGRHKVIYALPPLTKLALKKVTWPLSPAKLEEMAAKGVPVTGRERMNLFELRCGANQDCLPYSIHPDTGRPYQWVEGHEPDRWVDASGVLRLPVLPPAIVEFWQRLADDRDLRNEIDKLCPWRPLEVGRGRVVHGLSPRRAAVQDHHNIIGRFNAVTSIEDMLGQLGYERRGRRWLAPGSQSRIPGVVVLDADGIEKCYSHHGSDVLADGYAHDAFDLFALMCPNFDSAMDNAASMLGIDRHGPALPETLLGQILKQRGRELASGTATPPVAHQAGLQDVAGVGVAPMPPAPPAPPPRPPEGLALLAKPPVPPLPGLADAGLLPPVAPPKPPLPTQSTEVVKPLYVNDEFPPMPRELLEPDDPALQGNFIHATARWMLETAPYPQPELALVAAICVAATALGQKVQTGTGLRSNLYMVGVAETGQGKDHARKMVKKLLNDAGHGALVGAEEIASGPGLMTMMRDHGVALSQIDEFGLFLCAANGSGASGSHDRTVLDAMMKLYSSAQDFIVGKARADSRMNPRYEIRYPNLVVHATTTSKPLFAGLTSEHMFSGFLNRMLVVFAPRRRMQRRDATPGLTPQGLIDWVKACRTMMKGLAGVADNPITIPMTDSAKELFDQFEEFCQDTMANTVDTGIDALWSRSWEIASKISMLMACATQTSTQIQDTVNQNKLVVDFPHAVWAISLVKWITRQMASALKDNVADGEFDALLLDMKRVMRNYGGNGVTKRDIARHSAKFRNLTNKERDEALNTLMQQGDIEISVDFSGGSQGGRPTQKWCLVEHSDE